MQQQAIKPIAADSHVQPLKTCTVRLCASYLVRGRNFALWSVLCRKVFTTVYDLRPIPIYHCISVLHDVQLLLLVQLIKVLRGHECWVQCAPFVDCSVLLHVCELVCRNQLVLRHGNLILPITAHFIKRKAWLFVDSGSAVHAYAIPTSRSPRFFERCDQTL